MKAQAEPMAPNHGRTRRRISRRPHPAILVLLAVLVVWGIHSWRQNAEQASGRVPYTAQDLSLAPADKDAWYLLLANRDNLLPNDYKVELTMLDNGIEVDSRIYLALQEMFEAARAESVYPVVGSGYRTAEYQQQLLDEKVEAYRQEGNTEKQARKLAEAWVAIPGSSEHQMGIAVDINADKTICDNETVYNWLAKNAYRYGFILRYPPDKKDITKTIHEPWHYRYVGTQAAEEIHRYGLCLEEYLAALS